MSALAELQALLDAERTVIRTGDLDQLPALTERKIDLFARIEAAPGTDASNLRMLRDQAARNLALLEAARRGLAAALTQIGAALSASAPQTYGPDGRRDALGPTRQRIEKRC